MPRDTKTEQPDKSRPRKQPRRVFWRTTSSGYGGVAILLHWLIALLVLAVFLLGLWMTGLDYYDAWYQRGPDLHRSLGLLGLLLMLVRACWRLSQPRPMPLPGHRPWERVTARWVHRLLYVLVTATAIAGFLMSTADGRPVQVFGWFELPAFLPASSGREELAGTVHEILAWSLLALAALHAAAALKHHFLDRDRTLLRILFPRPERSVCDADAADVSQDKSGGARGTEP